MNLRWKLNAYRPAQWHIHTLTQPDLLLKFSCAVGAVKTCDDVRERRRWRFLPGSFLMVRVDIYPGRLWAVAAAPTEVIQPAIQNTGIYSDGWNGSSERSGDVRPPWAHAADTMHLTWPLSEPQALCRHLSYTVHDGERKETGSVCQSHGWDHMFYWITDASSRLVDPGGERLKTSDLSCSAVRSSVRLFFDPA